MARQGFDFFTLIHVCKQRVSNWLGEINHHLIAAFARHQARILKKIKIIQIYTNTFTNANTRTQEQRNDRKISDLGLFLKFLKITYLQCSMS